MIFRDDDISYLTDVKQFKRVHEIFIEHNVVHTIAVIASGIEKNQELIEYIKMNSWLMDVQLHCWEHIDYSQNESDIYEHMRLSRRIFKRVFGEYPKVFYPPWNKATQFLIDKMKDFHMELSNEKVSLSQYIRTKGGVNEKVVNFHYWADEEVIQLEPALKIYNERKNKCV